MIHRPPTHRQERLRLILLVAALLPCFAWPGSARAQSTPVDLTDVGLAELMEMEVEQRSGARSDQPIWSRFNLGYRYVRAKFEDYRKDTEKIASEDLLGPPSADSSTFPVVPTVIIQQAHILDLSVDITDRTSAVLIFPVSVNQSTDHISVVPGYDEFNISSQGIGDLTLSFSYSLPLHSEGSGGSLSLSAGMSFPTGSIDEKGDTPRAPGKQQLPYTMQLGSGTYDFPVSVSYRSAAIEVPWMQSISYGAQAFGKIRTGLNSRSYRLGNRLALNTWLKARPLDWFEPMIRFDVVFWERIRGEDESLKLPNGLYPAPVTNPDLFGGTKIHFAGGATFRWPRGVLEDSVGAVLDGVAIDVEGAVPIYQRLNGPQPQEEYQLKAGVRYDF